MIKNGTVIAGRYEVKRKIGTGGTSSVYLVCDKHIGRNLAMKVMDKRSLGAFRFARSEIESLRRVRYPLFPAIHDAFADKRHIFIISEYVKGRSLWDTVKGGGMHKDRAMTLITYICEALAYLHELDKPILYLDLKPDNVIIDDEGMPHMIDFGIAGWLAAKHVPVGTIGYSPPEQYKEDALMDARTDLYALGMTYYAIRHGIPPDPDPDAAVSNIRHSPILGRSEKSFLAKCIAPSMEDRYTDAREVLRQIKHIRSNPYRIRKKTLRIVLAAGAVLLALFGAEKAVTYFRENKAAGELIKKATVHMQDGQYTSEGIGLIKACINSGTLSEECEQDFIFEVAMNMMLISKDYRGAAGYFAKLDRAKYPEANDYIRLCRMQSGFETAPKEAAEVTSKLFADIAGRAPSGMKYENLIFIALCFENYDEDEVDGLIKAVSVLKIAEDEIDSIDKNPSDMNEEELERIKDRIGKLRSVKEKQIKIRKQNSKMIGETYEEKNNKK